MKDYLDCAYHRGYRMGEAIHNVYWTAYSGYAEETERLLVGAMPHNPEMFQKATGHYLPTATEDEVIAAIKWWARGYCKGRTGGT